jgi:small-conductance mechanosensitive channel
MTPGLLLQEPPALQLREVILALITFGVWMSVAFVLNALLQRVGGFVTRRTKTTLDDRLLQAIRPPLLLLLTVVGSYLALLQITLVDPYQPYIRSAVVILVVFCVASGVNRALSAGLTWYGQEMAARTRTDVDEKLLPILRRVLFVVIWGIALMVIFDRLNLNISPLVTGLGITGLAVALALQPTLSNFFSGTYLLTDQAVRPGDFIQLDSGVMGTVREVGWRTTKIMTPENNLVIIPNNRLADAIVTNYFQPDRAVNVVVNCGVAYESDLDQVERVALEEATRVQKSHPGAVPDWTPLFRFREFGESNVNFIVVLRAIDRGNSFLVVHEFIKALHRRFAREGITINYPARTLYLANRRAALEQVLPRSRAEAGADPPASPPSGSRGTG